MSDLRKLFDWLFGTKATLSPARRKPRPSFKPQLEGLEDRIAPAGTVVDTAADDGSAGSLRQVLANAPANSTITFDPTVFPPNPGELAVISLNPTRGPISITANNLTIDGGQSDIAIDGQDQIRIFSIFGGNLTETIQNLQLMRGFGEVTENEGQEGGAIDDVSDGSLTLINDTFSSNVANGGGGAVRANLDAGNTLTVTNCTFTGNQTTAGGNGAGGAIESEADGLGNNIIVTGCTFTGNSADSFGGAIFAAGSQLLQITKTEFVNNTSGADGGAVTYVSAPAVPSSLLLTYSTFTNNQAQNGGGVSIDAANNDNTGTVTETINGCLFSGNEATASNGRGGGLDVEQRVSGSGSATVNLLNSTFYNNTSDGYGGGIYLQQGATIDSVNNMLLNLTSLTITKNQASTQGGGLYVQLAPTFAQANPAPTLTNNIIAGNTIGNPPDSGPDIFGSITTRSYNLVGIGDGVTVTNNDGKWLPGDQVGTSADPKVPGLDPNGPQNNGGPTWTIKLLKTSIGYGAGDDFLIKKPDGSQLDQRGFKRQVGKDIRASAHFG